MLCLEDVNNYTYEELVNHIIDCYEVEVEEVEKYDFLIAYESVGSWGCDSSSFFLLKEKKTGKLFENHGSYCSCFGFEGQWNPEETTVEYLKSDHFYFCCGGYDNSEEFNKNAVYEYIKAL
jgi:hypothetical protein